MSDTSQRVIRVLCETQGLDAATVKPQSTFEELGIDSFDGLNILFAVENEFDIQVPDEEARNLRSVAQMIEGVEKLLSAKQQAAGR